MFLWNWVIAEAQFRHSFVPGLGTLKKHFEIGYPQPCKYQYIFFVCECEVKLQSLTIALVFELIYT